MKERVEALIFDILCDQCFSQSFETKEPFTPYSQFKAIPNAIEEYLKLIYPITKSPLLDAVIWLKPRGLNWLINACLPKHVQEYYNFEIECVTRRLNSQPCSREKTEKPAPREDFIHFLSNTKGPEGDEPGLSQEEILAEAHMLIIAGTHTTSVALSATLFYICSNSAVWERLSKEIRSVFVNVEEIVYGKKLMNCRYLRACIDESLRISPPGPSEFPREVLQGGAVIDGDFYSEGVVVGAAGWASGHDENVYGDPEVFRPERWVESEGNTAEEITRIRRGFTPFLKGPGNCVGQNLAILELMMTVGRLVFCADCRLASNVPGGGIPKQYDLRDAFVAAGKGPILKFKRTST